MHTNNKELTDNSTKLQKLSNPSIANVIPTCRKILSMTTNTRATTAYKYSPIIAIIAAKEFAADGSI